MAEGTTLTAEVFRQRLSTNWTDEGWLKGQTFQPRTTDIVVVGNLKSGTTWMQHIIHQLSTGGDMDFINMSQVVQVLELAHDRCMDLEVEQKGFPRCFKTHYWYPHCPKGGKYIWCVREPCACAYSYFKMFEGWLFQPGEVSVEDFIRNIWLPQGEPKRSDLASYFHHLASWWAHRNDPNVLLVFYEDLKECYESSVRSVAEFMGIKDEGCIQVALERGTFEFMKQHSDKFGVFITHIYRNNIRVAVPEAARIGKSKVRTGSTTEGLEMLSAEVRSEIQKKWEAVVSPVTGCASYSELRAAWKKEKER